MGKSTLINSLFLTDLYSKDYPGPSLRIKKTVQVAYNSFLHMWKCNTSKGQRAQSSQANTNKPNNHWMVTAARPEAAHPEHQQPEMEPIVVCPYMSFINRRGTDEEAGGG